MTAIFCLTILGLFKGLDVTYGISIVAGGVAAANAHEGKGNGKAT